jgi:hypothetical protein
MVRDAFEITRRMLKETLKSRIPFRLAPFGRGVWGRRRSRRPKGIAVRAIVQTRRVWHLSCHIRPSRCHTRVSTVSMMLAPPDRRLFPGAADCGFMEQLVTTASASHATSTMQIFAQVPAAAVGNTRKWQMISGCICRYNLSSRVGVALERPRTIAHFLVHSERFL